MEQDVATLILAQLNEMNSKLAKLDTKFDNLNSKVDLQYKTLNAKIDNVFYVLNERIDNVKNTL